VSLPEETGVAATGSALVVGVGASLGLGAASARRFAREGLHVVVAGRTAEKVQRVADEICVNGGSAQAVVGDAAIEEDAIRFVEAAQAKGPLALVLHNCGSNRRDDFTELASSDFQQIWREHCLAGFLVGRESARRMLAHGRGTILFTGATGSLRGSAYFAAFAAAKAGLRAVAQSMARELGPRGIHVGHVIIDGGIDGERLKARMPELIKERGPDGLLSIDAIADAYWQLHLQHRSAWTFEQDLRPWSEKF
jgi:NAD(P)-dependent dehydrogenase (short-subunit alcohol dehydrogenase family)